MRNGRFFTPGGTLPPNAASYVSRRADRDLIHTLTEGEIAYVLDSRQKGKSSLIVHSLGRLHERGTRTIRIDLQRLGTNLRPDQWYAGIVHTIGQETGLTAELYEYWQSLPDLGPAIRCFSALEKIVLPRIPGPIVVFIDEVDFVKALPFSTDELFASIREWFNRRSTTPELRRLTFCLAGVASPSQLIQNEDVTPFNVGVRIELDDFTEEETSAYAEEIGKEGRNGKALMARIHYWVNGHPYLTQLMASEVANDEAIQTSRQVDELVESRLLAAENRQREPNIADAERRLLETQVAGVGEEEARSQVLELYRLLLDGKLVSAEHQEALVAVLLLSGVAIEDKGHLRIRNRLYSTIFDERWRRNNLPDAEARRQRGASRRASFKVAWSAAAALVAAWAVVAWLLVLTTDRDRALSQTKRLSQENTRIAYQSSMALAAERMKEGDYLSAQSLIETQRQSPESGWEWGFLHARFAAPRMLAKPKTLGLDILHPFFWWREKTDLVRIVDQDIFVNEAHVAKTSSFNVSYQFAVWLRMTRGTKPIGERIREGLPANERSNRQRGILSPNLRIQAFGQNDDARLLVLKDLSTGHSKSFAMAEPIRGLAFSGDGQWATIGAGGTASWSLNTLTGQVKKYGGVASPDGKYLATIRLSTSILILRASDGAPVCRLEGHRAPCRAVEWFRDGKRLATCSDDGTARIWSIPDGTLLQTFVGDSAVISSIALNDAEDRLLATTSDDGVYEWPIDHPVNQTTIRLHSADVLLVSTSPDGRRCITDSEDGTAVLFEMPTGSKIATFHVGFRDRALPISFSRDGEQLAIADTDGTILFINPADGAVVRRLSVPGKHPQAIAFAPKGQFAAGFAEGGFLSLDNRQGSPSLWQSAEGDWSTIQFSPDGSLLAAGNRKGTVGLFDYPTFKVRRPLLTRNSIVNAVEFSPDGKQVSIATAFRTAYVAAVDGKKPVLELFGHGSRVWQARYSPDGTRLLTTSYDGTARIWNASTGSLLQTLRHGAWVAAAEWSPDGKRVMTACSDGFLRIFEPDTGFELIRLAGHGGYVLDGEFTRDGKTIVTGNSDGTVEIWSTEPKLTAHKESVANGPG